VGNGKRMFQAKVDTVEKQLHRAKIGEERDEK